MTGRGRIAGATLRVGIRVEPGSIPDVPAPATGHCGGMSNYDNYSPTRGRRLTRRSHDKMVAGVCGGVADHFGIDANLVRLLLVAAVIFGFGTGIVLYVAGWILMPQA
jgi:phage shock protein C